MGSLMAACSQHENTPFIMPEDRLSLNSEEWNHLPNTSCSTLMLLQDLASKIWVHPTLLYLAEQIQCLHWMCLLCMDSDLCYCEKGDLSSAGCIWMYLITHSTSVLLGYETKKSQHNTTTLFLLASWRTLSAPVHPVVSFLEEVPSWQEFPRRESLHWSIPLNWTIEWFVIYWRKA